MKILILIWLAVCIFLFLFIAIKMFFYSFPFTAVVSIVGCVIAAATFIAYLKDKK